MDAEAVFVFRKKLSNTDISHRLSFPSDKLESLPEFAPGCNQVEFQVSCGTNVYTFCCVTRREGPPKPVIERGWSAVVRDNDFKPDDFLEFYQVKTSDHEPARYKIEVHRRSECHNDEMGTAYSWQCIV